MERGRARIVNGSQGPEYGDASACLKITYPGDPARPVIHLFKMHAPFGVLGIPMEIAELMSAGVTCRWRSVRVEVTFDLPGRHMPHVVTPLRALGSEEVVEDVLAQGFAHEGALLQFIQRFAQI